MSSARITKTDNLTITETIYNVNGTKFTSLRKAIDYAKRVCFDEQRKCSVWVDGEREARATFCRTSEGKGGVYRAEPDYDDAPLTIA